MTFIIEKEISDIYLIRSYSLYRYQIDVSHLYLAIDFIIKLPILRILGSNDKFDNIFIIINRKGKIIYFVLYREVINAEEFVSLFYRIIISRYRMPAEIILDRDKLFISKFWKSLIVRLKVE